jgi:gamma-glutamyltranspeptidase
METVREKSAGLVVGLGLIFVGYFHLSWARIILGAIKLWLNGFQVPDQL